MLDYVYIFGINYGIKYIKKELYRCSRNATKTLVKNNLEGEHMKAEEKLSNSFDAITNVFWREVGEKRREEEY